MTEDIVELVIIGSSVCFCSVEEFGEDEEENEEEESKGESCW